LKPSKTSYSKSNPKKLPVDFSKFIPGPQKLAVEMELGAGF